MRRMSRRMIHVLYDPDVARDAYSDGWCGIADKDERPQNQNKAPEQESHDTKTPFASGDSKIIGLGVYWSK